MYDYIRLWPALCVCFARCDGREEDVPNLAGALFAGALLKRSEAPITVPWVDFGFRYEMLNPFRIDPARFPYS